MPSHFQTVEYLNSHPFHRGGSLKSLYRKIVDFDQKSGTWLLRNLGLIPVPGVKDIVPTIVKTIEGEKLYNSRFPKDSIIATPSIRDSLGKVIFDAATSEKSPGETIMENVKKLPTRENLETLRDSVLSMYKPQIEPIVEQTRSKLQHSTNHIMTLRASPPDHIPPVLLKKWGPKFHKFSVAQQSKLIEAYNKHGGAFEIVKSAPKKVKMFLNKYGDSRIVGITVCRSPLKSILTKFINVVTFGKLLQEVKSKNYDDVFHLYLLFRLESGVSVLLEKNQRVEIRQTTGDLNNPDLKCMRVGDLKDTTLTQFIHNAELAVDPERLWVYRAASNNCQQFCLDMLQSNLLLTPELKNFIHQDVSGAIKEGSFLSRLSNVATDLAHRVDAFKNGGKVLKRKRRHKI